MHTNFLHRASAFSVVLVIATCISALPAEAQTRSSRDWRTYFRSTSEGSAPAAEQEQAISRRGVSSAAQKAINNLDKDPVKKIPIPILLGVTLKQITSDFGDPRDGGERTHEGQDILAPRDAYIVSPTDAVVVRTGTGDSSGNYVYTANPGGETFDYMHLDKIADGIKSGKVLKKGDLIGYVGDTGNAKGGPTHLHFEIRKGRTATDPYPRLEGEFSLKERIDAIEEILKDSDDEDDEAEALVSSYRGIFVAAAAQDIDLPSSIEDALGSVANIANTSFTRDLTLGSQGDDVIALQAFLMSKDSGAKAKALTSAGATGYFGAITQSALAEYQALVGLSPAVGYFGPLTRAYVAANK